VKAAELLRRPLMLAPAFLLAWSWSSSALACAACACGDPTLLAAGSEQPFTGRMRPSAELRYRTDSVGEPGVDEFQIREWRATLSFAYAPLSELFVIGILPVVDRLATDVSLARYRSFGLGDAEFRLKWFVARDPKLGADWLIAVTGGVKFPTGAFHRDADGELLPMEAQPGTGSWDLLFAPSLSVFVGQTSFYGMVQGTLPVATRPELSPGPGLLGTFAGQYQFWEFLALRAVVDVRLERPTHENGQEDPNSGGALLMAGPDLLVSPLADLTFGLGFRLPVVQALRGAHEEGPAFSASAALDL
jgi:hypothetical protein